MPHGDIRPIIHGRKTGNVVLEQLAPPESSPDAHTQCAWAQFEMLPGKVVLTANVALLDSPSRPAGCKVRLAVWSGAVFGFEGGNNLSVLGTPAYAEDWDLEPGIPQSINRDVIVDTAGVIVAAVILHVNNVIIPMNPDPTVPYWGQNPQGYLYSGAFRCTLLQPYIW